MPKRTNPGDVANLFVRCFLADVGESLGGCSDTEWLETLEFFENRCAYTGTLLPPAATVMDHAIPINRAHCGLHLVGNLVPSTDEANKRKHHRHFREFVTDADRLAKIEEWLTRAKYWERASRVGDLRDRCAEKYATILKLCESGRDSAFEAWSDRDTRPTSRTVERTIVGRTDEVLPIELIAPPDRDFKTELLRRKQAWIHVEFGDGRVEKRLWTADRLTATSNIIGNLRSRPEFRAGAWQSRGIKRLFLTLT